MHLSSALRRWQNARLLDADAAQRIAAFEAQRGAGRFSRSIIALGALAIVLGFAAIIGANWQEIPASVKLGCHLILNLALGLALYTLPPARHTARELLAFLLMGASLTFLALIGQVYQTQAPPWQPLSFWLLTVTPFMLCHARHRATITVWCLAFIITMASLGEAIQDHRDTLPATMLISILFGATPLVMIAIGQLAAFRQRLPQWGAAIAFWGVTATALGVSVCQALWYGNNHDYTRQDITAAAILPALLVNIALIIGMRALRKTGILVPIPFALDSVLLIGTILAALPVLIPHDDLPVMAAALFMAYWLLVGWAALALGRYSIFNLAVILVALRLVIIYCEVFGSLLQTGMGLIISGALLIALVMASNRIIQSFGRKKSVAL